MFKKILVAFGFVMLSTTSFAVSTTSFAECVGSAAYRTCYDSSGNNYNVSRSGNSTTPPVTKQEIERLIYAYAQLTLAADNGSIVAIREKQKMKSSLTEYQKHQALLLARKMLFSELNPDR